MTAPIETPVETAPEALPMAEDQASWVKFTPEMRDHAMREGELPPVEPPKPPEETPAVEPPEKPPAEPPVKIEGKPETPPPEEPVKPVAEPPKEPPPTAGQEEPKRLYAGQYESVEAMEKALTEKQATIDRQGGELGELRKQTQPKPEPEPEDPEPVRDFYDETSLKAHDEWMLRETDRRNKAFEKRIAQGLRQFEAAQPVRKMIEKFAEDHPDVSPEKQFTVGQHADNMARATGKPVSLEAAYADLFGATTETPSKPEEPPKGEETAEAIVAASELPTTVSNVPTSPPATEEGTLGEVLSQAEWNALPEAERERRKKAVPSPPAE